MVKFQNKNDSLHMHGFPLPYLPNCFESSFCCNELQFHNLSSGHFAYLEDTLGRFQRCGFGVGSLYEVKLKNSKIFSLRCLLLRAIPWKIKRIKEPCLLLEFRKW